MIRNQFLDRIKELKKEGIDVIFTSPHNFFEYKTERLFDPMVLDISEADSIDIIEAKIRKIEIKVEESLPETLYEYLRENL